VSETILTSSAPRRYPCRDAVSATTPTPARLTASFSIEPAGLGQFHDVRRLVAADPGVILILCDLH
jgi:hypothetical protein